MPVPHLRPTHNHPAYSLLNTLCEKGILEGLQKPSTFKSGTLVRKCRFYIGGKEKSRRIEYRQGERSVSRRKESGIDERDRVQERNVGEQYRS